MNVADVDHAMTRWYDRWSRPVAVSLLVFDVIMAAYVLFR